jgi:ABC-2 type transport system ATP-binding protein
MIEAAHLSTNPVRNYPPVKDVSFVVDRGDSYCLLGTKDSGKSTLIEVFRSVLAPTSGQALVHGLDCQSHPLAVRQQTLFVTPGSALVPSLSLRDNVSFFATLAGRRPSRESIDNALRRFAIPERAFGIVAGEVDRRELLFLTWLAVGLIRKVPAFVVDDPSLDLDGRAAEWIVEGIRETQSAGGALLIATADARFAAAVGTRVGILRGGRIEAEYRGGEIADERLTGLNLDHLGRFGAATNPLKTA